MLVKSQNNSALSKESSKIRRCIGNLHKMIEICINKDVKSSPTTRTQMYIDDLFSPFVTDEASVYSYYKTVFEFKVLKNCYEKGNFAIFNDSFERTDTDLMRFASGNFSFLEGVRLSACKMLSELYVMKAKYWSRQS